jgi:RHS repeat-associated protein
VQDLAYGYDAADNITSITDAITSGRSQTFTYDSLFRLKTAAATGTYGSITYNYDDVGNRTSVVDGAGTESYSTDTSSNRLLSATLGSTTRSFSYDGAGNITADATGSTTYGLAYNKANRLAGVSLNGTPDTDYLYNALGERVKKAPAATPTAGSRFHYDRDGKLIAETDSTGAVIREYAWLGGLPIGEFTNASAGTPPGQTQLDNTDSGASFTGSWTTATAGSGYIGSDYHQHTPLSVPAGGTVIDNGSANFKTTGVWHTAATPSGFEGSDYVFRDLTADGYGSTIIVDNADASGFVATGVWTLQTTANAWVGSQLQHTPNQLPPEAIVVDNVDAGFALTGTWSTATSSGKYGTDFRYAPANQATPDSVITDNDAASTSLTGTWSTSTASGRYGTNFRYSSAGTGSNTFTWTPTIPSSQQYVVYAWWKASGTYATNAPFTIYHDGGSTTVSVNQQINGSRWYPLGTFSLTPGQNHRVVLTNDANGLAIADAVMITPVGSVFRATWTPTIPQSDQYNVYGWWKANSTYVTSAPFTIVHGGGTTTVTVNQQTNGGQWNPLGTFSMAPGQNHRVFMTDQGTGGDTVIADAVQVTRVGAPPPMAIFTPTLPARDRYLAYARWYYFPSYANNAPFVIQHEGGSTTVRMSQADSALSKKWNLLGTFTLGPGQGHGIELHDDASATVIADAVEFVPESAVKTATWEIPDSIIAQTGSYQVYAKWPVRSDAATDATYTVSYEGGTQAVTVNQRVNGGQWNLLGSFAFNASGSGYKVELAESPNGKVTADAIYIAGAGGPPSDEFTWTPTFPSAGAYQVYARWPASSANTGAAQYTVTRDGGNSTVTLNQKQNGSSWALLGSYNFAPAAGQKVTLAASADGATIADALLFVGAGAQPANLLYVHADHLGSPQKMTDASQATVWDGVFDPFGEEVTLTGLAAMSVRFPGQYADAETGYSYNYFRDYDPSIGRYLQSDPIGLVAGLNTFSYVDQNPITNIDPTGECPWCIAFVVGAGIDLVFQLIDNGGRLECVDVQSLLLSGVLGIVGGEVWGRFASNALKRGMSRLNSAFPRGREWVERSRMWPGRWGGPHSEWNQKLMWGSDHARIDPFRHRLLPEWWKKQNPLHSWWRRLWERTPDWLKGSASGGTIGAGLDSASECECK